MPDNCNVQLDAAAFNFVGENSSDAPRIEHMHVRGISGWAPANIGPYSQAVSVGKLLFLAGQIGLDPPTMTLPEGIESQTALALKNAASVVKVGALARMHCPESMNDFALRCPPPARSNFDLQSHRARTTIACTCDCFS